MEFIFEKIFSIEKEKVLMGKESEVPGANLTLVQTQLLVQKSISLNEGWTICHAISKLPSVPEQIHYLDS